MKSVETLESFYQKIYKTAPDRRIMQFSIMDYRHCAENITLAYRRCDFFKVTYLTGHYILHYGDKSLEIEGTFLAFFSPDIPYTVETLGPENNGAFFIFRESYFNDFFKGHVRKVPVFSDGKSPIYLLESANMTFVDNIFYKITAEMASDYEFKHDLIRGYILELIHYALKMQPSERLYDQIDAKTRITHVFNELLERQFPIESLEQKVEIRSPSEYANKLGVHVNYLNKALRDTTGKTTSQHIADRLISEAIALLKHSDWSISEISYALGFEDPSHFNHFFKKQTSQPPKSYRMPVVR